MQSRRKENKANFIKTIRTCSFLFDYNHPDYRNKSKSEAKWTQLAEEFGYDDALDAKTTWKNIVTAYNKTKAPNALGAEPKKPYIFADEMTFMDGIRKNGAPLNLNSIRPSSTDHSFEQFENFNEQLEEKYENEEPTAKRFKKTEESTKEVTDASDKTLLQTVSSVIELMAKRESPGELFGRTVAIALDDMSKKIRMQAQLEIQQVLLKYTD